jgi:uncharacterized protein YdeI (YjbR/CyaY-like superfamily)
MSKADAAPELPILPFKTKKAWATWLERNHAKSPGIWMRFMKKATGEKSITYDEALEVALCYGWIDGQGKSEGERSHIQKWVPRRKRSIWSKRNTEKALALIESGDMKPAGLAEIERAKADGRWEAAYDSPSRATVPPDLEAALKKKPRAQKFFETLNSTNRYAILHRIQTAKKPETRERRIEQFVEMLAKGEKLYP